MTNICIIISSTSCLLGALTSPGLAQESPREPSGELEPGSGSDMPLHPEADLESGPDPASDSQSASDPISAIPPPPDTASRSPSPEHRRAAEQLCEHGRALYNELLYSDAVERFHQAASYWAHPQIELYLALARLRSGDPVAAHRSLQRAAALGLDQLDPEDRERAEELGQTLLDKHLAVIEIRCDEPGAQVSLDGKPLFVGPGTHSAWVRPASHVVRADKPGYFPARQSINLLPGHRGSIVIVLGEDKMIETRRWTAWKPWAVVGAGATLGLLGVGAWWQGERDFDRAGDAAICPVEDPACPPSTPRPYGRAVLEVRLGVGLAMTGAAVTATGLLLVRLNRPYEKATEAPETPMFDIAPLIEKDRLGVMSRFRF